jgi:hypothetical protein
MWADITCVLVAYTDTGGQLGPDGEDGFARIVVPGDIAGGTLYLQPGRA